MRMMIAADLHILFVQLQVHFCSGNTYSFISITKKLAFPFPDTNVWNADTKGHIQHISHFR